jgi:uncharacterized protein (UPF0264 family)
VTQQLSQPGRLKLLVSVRNAAEAEAALEGGADWIDLKEPACGPLGAVDASIAREVVACTAGRASVSAAAGELADWRDAAPQRLLDVAGISYVKLGLAGYRGKAWRHGWQAARDDVLSAGKELAAVIYVDKIAAACPDWLEIVQVAQSLSCGWVLMDTFDKVSGTLGSNLSHIEMRTVLAAIRGGDQRTVAAGRLNAESIAKLPLDLIDMIAVRGAACGGKREGKVRRECVAELRALLTALESRSNYENSIFPRPEEFA